jgi:hypothetical protein
MTPDELAAVDRSWAELRRHHAVLVDRLTASFDTVAACPESARGRARWLVDAVSELVGLLTAPSQLAVRARRLAATWPDARTAPSFRVEGRAWMGSAQEVSRTWSDQTEEAWRQAWLLLSDVLAQESLSPFADLPPKGAPGRS